MTGLAPAVGTFARLRLLLLPGVVTVAGALGAVLVAAVVGMNAGAVEQLLGLLGPAVVATLAGAALVDRQLGSASLRLRFGAVAALASCFALSNLVVLSWAMFVNPHDAALLGALLVYSVAVGMAVALLLGKSTAAAVERLEHAAHRLGRGDLTARTDDDEPAMVDSGGPELWMLARTLDEMAERLQQAQARERDAEAVRRDLISAVSHDLRTPLASLRAMVEAVADEVIDDPASLRRYSFEMGRSVGQLSKLVDDLFELAQLEAGVIATETRRSRLGEIVETALATVAVPAAEKGLRLVAEVDTTADLTCSPRLERVLLNLLHNAVQHTPANGTVRLAATLRDDWIELAVENTGSGIRREDLDRVFDPFFRADPARHGPGAGLGLALSRRIVEAMGGRISAESVAAGGARFAVSLPL
ncbi:MAG: HAMP domain-containing histidine kinase [Acidimicrobiia bacterium]|nr:HAMP domain-containing histidine kinase [Acidimicrobiia bacterium]